MSDTCKEAGTKQKEVEDEIKTVKIITSVIIEGKDEASVDKVETDNNNRTNTGGDDEGNEQELIYETMEESGKMSNIFGRS